MVIVTGSSEWVSRVCLDYFRVFETRRTRRFLRNEAWLNRKYAAPAVHTIRRVPEGYALCVHLLFRITHDAGKLRLVHENTVESFTFRRAAGTLTACHFAVQVIIGN